MQAEKDPEGPYAFNVGTQLKTHIHLQATQELSGDWKTCFLISFASNC